MEPHIVFEDEYTDDEESSHLDDFMPLVQYEFNSEGYDLGISPGHRREQDAALATEIKNYYPELAHWDSKALSTAWRLYSKEVGLVEEEYVCARLPNFLAYLFVVQEKWSLNSNDWVTAMDAAKTILWPNRTTS